MATTSDTRRAPCFVYVLRCADGTLYTGWTVDVAARERAHNEAKGAKYTVGRRPVRVVYSEAHDTRSAAQQREAQLKRWTRRQKEALVAEGAARSRAACRPGQRKTR
jgi:putative endonuclease